MISVKVTPEHISIHGHARYAPIGSDIVCSAVSALSQTLIDSIEELTDDKIEYAVNQGMIDIYTKRLSDSGKLMIDSFILGVTRIAESYPDYIQVLTKSNAVGAFVNAVGRKGEQNE